jgi:hypothetical protein
MISESRLTEFCTIEIFSLSYLNFSPFCFCKGASGTTSYLCSVENGTGNRSKNLDQKTKLHGPSPRANYADRATANFLRIEGAMWSA